MPISTFRLVRALGAGTSLIALLASAVPAAADEPAADPGVARMSVIAGEVDVKRADSGDTFTAALNAPVSPGDYLSTPDDSRAEIEFDYGAALRVAPDTQLRFTRLDPQNHQLQLAEGTVDLRVFRGLASHPEVDTPAATIRPTTHGSYRITVTDDGNTLVTVRAGEASVITPVAEQTIGAGSSLLVSGSGDGTQTQLVAVVAYDDFDAFNSDRDAYIARAHDATYVDEGIVGADDLDGYGHWIDAADYGQVWVPNQQAAGWAPYHDGRWVWEPYYGWTWVAAEPWGWAPYHYGNWFYASGTGWCWYPGAYAPASPYVYRPALVAFFSFGGGGVAGSFAFGDVGWVPIAPFEPFHPWWGFGGHGWGYGGSTTIVNATYITNVNITTVYRNASVAGGAVAVSNANFQHGVFAHPTPITPAQLHDVQPVAGIVPVVPTRHNLAFNGSTAAPLGAAPIGAKFSHFAPPPVAPASFATQRAAVSSTAQTAYPEHAPLFVAKPAVPANPGLPSRPASETPAYASPEHSFTGTPGTPEHSVTGTPSEPEHTVTGNPASAGGSTTGSSWSRFNATPATATAKPFMAAPAETSAHLAPASSYSAPKTYTPKPYVSSHTGTAASAGAKKSHTPKETDKH
jgi:hypothetical protein